MGFSGFPYLGMPLNLAEPVYSEHVSSVFLFSFRVCDHNRLLCIYPLQLLNSSLYWSHGTIQSLISFHQVKQFILASGYVTDQGTKESSSSLYNTPHRGEYILYPDPYNFSDYLINNMVDFPSSGAWLVTIDTSRAESYIRIDSWFSSSEKKPWTDWLPLGDNHSSKSWSSCPWSWNSPSIRFGSFHYLLIESFQHIYVENSFTTQFPCR